MTGLEKIKIFGATKEEVELKKFNIFIGISLGNKLLTRELAENCLKWSLSHTKEKVAVLIADEIDEINWKVFNGLDKIKAREKVASKAQNFVDMFSWVVNVLDSKNPDQNIREKVNILLWDDIKTVWLKKSIEVVTEEFRTDFLFRDRVLSFVNKYCSLRKKTVSDTDKNLLAGYILAELPTLIGGIEFKAIRYDMLLYPTYIESGLSQFALDIQNNFYPGLTSRLHPYINCVMADVYLEKPSHLF